MSRRWGPSLNLGHILLDDVRGAFLLIGGMNSRLANSGIGRKHREGIHGKPSNNAKMKIALESYFKTQVELALYQDKGIEKA